MAYMFYLVLAIRDRKNSIWSIKRDIIELYLHIFNTQNDILFKISAPGFSLKAFLKLHKSIYIFAIY